MDTRRRNIIYLFAEVPREFLEIEDIEESRAMRTEIRAKRLYLSALNSKRLV